MAVARKSQREKRNSKQNYIVKANNDIFSEDNSTQHDVLVVKPCPPGVSHRHVARRPWTHFKNLIKTVTIVNKQLQNSLSPSIPTMNSYPKVWRRHRTRRVSLAKLIENEANNKHMVNLIAHELTTTFGKSEEQAFKLLKKYKINSLVVENPLILHESPLNLAVGILTKAKDWDTLDRFYQE